MITVKTRDGDAPSVFESFPGAHSWEVTREKTLKILAPNGGVVAEFNEWLKVYWTEDPPPSSQPPIQVWGVPSARIPSAPNWSGSASI